MKMKKKIYRLRRNVLPHTKTSRDWLREVRKEKGMTQGEVAELAEISRTYYVQIENDKYRKNPTPCTAKKIAKILGFNWTIFFENSKQLNNVSR